ncbi:MAG: RlmE family RNA methyltransferase [Tagaea sp.]|nr:RlmE family RNA methyltransferase [Azospirillum sp.]MCA3268315.1 RlmE family RNA methyltransferase [Azospirillum sp.]MCZ8123885.1 RlmE family RNA methyltransferase [Magnetospirillum sp.]
MTDKRLAERLKTAKGRSVSQQNWLRRQLNDPYVAKARDAGYRSRAAFKLVEIDAKARILRPGLKVVDLGAAPGGWTQVAIERKAASVVALDILEMDQLAGAIVLRADFLGPAASGLVRDALGGPADLVLSDMAPPTTGHRETDHLRIVTLVEAAFEFACETLRPGGAFVAKLRQGAEEQKLLKAVQARFAKLQRIKPPASRAESAEFYIAATGFKG